MSKVRIYGDTSGYVDIAVPAVAGTTTLNLDKIPQADISGNIAMDTDTLFVDAANNRVGIGTTTPNAGLEVLKSGGGKIRISETTDKYVEVIGYAEGSANGSTMAFHTNQSGTSTSTERMRINHNGYVGIGTTNPDQPLQVKGVIETQATNSTNGFMMYTYTDNTYRINYNGAGADELILTSGGALGLGNTPGAWSANYPALQIGQGATFTGHRSNTQTQLGQNWWVGTGNQYVVDGAASRLVMNPDSTIIFSQAPSGTAGATMSTTNDRLVIAPSGNVGIGTASPTSPITVTNTVNVLASNAQTAYDNATLRLNTHAHAGSSIGLSAGNISPNIQYIQGGYNEGTTAPITLNPYGGNVMIGTTVTGRGTEGADRFTIADATHSGMTIRSGTNSYGSINFSDSEGGAGEYAGSVYMAHGNLGDKLVLATAGSDRVTISGNNVGIGTQTPSAILQLTPPNDHQDTFRIYRGGTSGYQLNYMNMSLYGGDAISNVVSSDASGKRFIWQVNGTEAARIEQDGSLQVKRTTAGLISSGGARQGSVIKLHHEAQWEAGYNNTPTDFLGAVEFSSGDTSGSGLAGAGVRAAIRAPVQDAYNNVGLSFETGGTRAERMRIDYAGVVTKPYHPSFGAVGFPSHRYMNVWHGVDLNAWNFVYQRNTSHYNNSNGRFTAPVAGMYHFYYHSMFTNPNTNDYHVQIKINGTALTYSNEHSGGSSGNGHQWNGASVELTVNLNAGDYATCASVGNSSSTCYLYGSGASSRYSSWGGYLLG